ncbi:MarR family transcriptional regulator [Streptomyces ferrugineus]|uniref:MarR family transcriptional regulator n=1 Tax=Streptomyces ferrugineus TaxID=1413221 RepID=A0A7M2T089_9ACTN|nr:MarR family transcriptional regulator [Streptomyces ferrugineus]QOV41285.1 MarR family transcriptional regulator [Streptomyces ferrugineus]
MSHPLGHTTVLTARTAVVAALCRAGSVVRQHLENSVLRGADLTWTAFVVLRVVWVRGESETRHVAREAGISKGTLTGVSRTLERRGFIRRSDHPCDGRLVLLDLTADGEALMLRLSPKMDEEVAYVTARLSDEECRSVTEVLWRVVHHVEERGEERLQGPPPTTVNRGDRQV